MLSPYVAVLAPVQLLRWSAITAEIVDLIFVLLSTTATTFEYEFCSDVILILALMVSWRRNKDKDLSEPMTQVLGF